MIKSLEFLKAEQREGDHAQESDHKTTSFTLKCSRVPNMT